LGTSLRLPAAYFGASTKAQPSDWGVLRVPIYRDCGFLKEIPTARIGVFKKSKLIRNSGLFLHMLGKDISPKKSFSCVEFWFTLFLNKLI